MNEVLLLGRRAAREVVRMPEATIPTLFIPLFFLVVNIGQVSRTFPSSTAFLRGEGYVAFQLPVSLMFAVATATSGLALVTDIELGYFDKLLVAPVRRSSIIVGRLMADLVRGSAASALVLLVGIALGASVRSGVVGAIVIVVLSSMFGVAYAGFGILIALRTRNVQATQSSFLLFFPLLFLTPNFVPFDRLSSDGDAGPDQPDQLRDRGPAGTHHRWLERGAAGGVHRRHPRPRGDPHRALVAHDRDLRSLTDSAGADRSRLTAAGRAPGRPR